MTTLIKSNGSRMAGQENASIDELLDVLAKHTLDPRFEDYGNFAQNCQPGTATVCFFGNFRDVSHVFDIRTDDAELVVRLIAAIKANQATQAYADAKREVVAERAHLMSLDRRR